MLSNEYSLLALFFCLVWSFITWQRKWNERKNLHWKEDETSPIEYDNAFEWMKELSFCAMFGLTNINYWLKVLVLLRPIIIVNMNVTLWMAHTNRIEMSFYVKASSKFNYHTVGWKLKNFKEFLPNKIQHQISSKAIVIYSPFGKKKVSNLYQICMSLALLLLLTACFFN